jgi:DNA primase
MRRVIDAARPMVDLLWQRETEGRVFDSPERKAALDKSLRAALARIKDPSIRSHYGEDIKRLRWQLFGQSVRPLRGPRRGPTAPVNVTAARSSALAGSGQGRADEHLLIAVLLATLITHPGLIARFESALETLDPVHPDQRRLCDALLRHAHAPNTLRAAIDAEMPGTLESLMAEAHVRIAPPVRNAADEDLALMCVAEGLAKLEARRGAQQEIAEAVEDMAGVVDEGLTWRLSQAAEARNRADRSKLMDASDMGEDRAALSKRLQDLIDGQIWIKKKG